MEPSQGLTPSSRRTADDAVDEIDAAWEGLRQVEQALEREVDAAVVAVCRRRLVALLEPNRAAGDRGDANASNQLERCCVDLTEQFVLDVNAIDDALVDALREHLSEGQIYHFVRWVQVAEARLRAALVLRHHGTRTFAA